MTLASIALWVLATGWLLGTLGAALSQPLKRLRLNRIPSPSPALPVSLIVPVSSPAPALSQCATSLAALDYPALEIILCCDEADRAAATAIEAAVQRHPTLKSRAVAPVALGNPKSALLAAAVPLAAHDLLLLSDDNVVSSSQRIAEHLAVRAAGHGLVSACALGEAAESFWGEVDAAFMNGQFARLQCAGDAVGLSFSTGKSMLVSRRDLLASGGFAPSGNTMCEDAVVQRQLVRSGQKVALTAEPVRQPIGRRDFGEVWHRHLRWATCRRQYAPLLFGLELIASAPVAVLAGGAAAGSLGLGFASGASATAVIFLGAEWIFLRLAGWPTGRAFPAAWAARELLAPVLWLAALLPRRRTYWRNRPLSLRR
ncbi:glycosyltransferase [Reyranella sp.]|uniref:glycosyltransferase n=1 Tax=Reyranella sp. TaxID=1929291 RepID=UPI0025E9F31B|nr:glycosyltransferase [Reyranella sp.]